MTEHKALAKQNDPIFNLLAGQKVSISQVLPKGMTPEGFLKIAHMVINKNNKLRSCTPHSLINGIIEGGSLGLTFGQTCHLIPFGKEAVFDADYKGLIELGYRSGQITLWRLKPVYMMDDFEYNEGQNELLHKWSLTAKRGELIGAYSHVKLTSGEEDYLVINKDVAMAAKSKSAGGKSKDSPWNNENEWQMWCKTAARLHAKTLPSSPELQRAAQLTELADSGIKQNISHYTEAVDAEFTTAEEKPTKPADDKEAIQAKIAAVQKRTDTQPETQTYTDAVGTTGGKVTIEQVYAAFPKGITNRERDEFLLHRRAGSRLTQAEMLDVVVNFNERWDEWLNLENVEPAQPETPTNGHSAGPIDAEEQERRAVIAAIREYDEQVVFLAKKELAFPVSSGAFPPSLDGCNRLIEQCAEIVQKQ